MVDLGDPLLLFFAGCAGFSGLFLFIAAVNGAFHSHAAHHLHAGDHHFGSHGVHAVSGGHVHHAASPGHHGHLGHASHHLHLGKHVHHVNTSHAAPEANAGHGPHDTQLHHQGDHHGHDADRLDRAARAVSRSEPVNGGASARLQGYWLGLTALAVRSLNVYAILTFLFYFGVVGTLMRAFHVRETVLVFAVPTVVGLLAALACTAILHRLFGDTAGLVTHENSRLRGREVRVTHAIRAGGTGEVIFVPRGGVAQNIPARSVDGKGIPVGQRAVVVEISRGVAFVEPLDVSADAADGEHLAAL